MNDEHALDLPQMALGSIGYIALGSDSPVDAYVLGWLDGRHKAQEYTDKEDTE